MDQQKQTALIVKLRRVLVPRWHQPCQRCKYTTSVDIQKTRYKKASHSRRTTCERNESAQESGEQRYISDHQSNVESRDCITVLLELCGASERWQAESKVCCTVTALLARYKCKLELSGGQVE